MEIYKAHASLNQIKKFFSAMQSTLIAGIKSSYDSILSK